MCAPPYSRTRTGGGHLQRRRGRWIEHRREGKMPRKQRRRLAGFGVESTEVILCSLRQTLRCCRYPPLLRVLEDGGDVVYVFEVFGRPSGKRTARYKGDYESSAPIYHANCFDPELPPSCVFREAVKRHMRVLAETIDAVDGTNHTVPLESLTHTCVRFLLPTVTKCSK